MASQCNCAIGTSAFKDEIEQFIKDDRAYTVINDWLRSHLHKELKKVTISIHKTKHMGLPPSKMSDKRKFEVIPRIPGKVLSINEVRDLAMQEFGARLKAAPHLIGNAQLIPFLVEALRAENRRPPSDPLDAILALFSEVTAPDETSARSAAEVKEADRGPEGLPDELDGLTEDRQDASGSEGIYPSITEGSI